MAGLAEARSCASGRRLCAQGLAKGLRPSREAWTCDVREVTQTWCWLAEANIWREIAGRSRVASICKTAAELAASRASISQSPQSALIWAAGGPNMK